MDDKLLRYPDLAPYFPDGRLPHQSTLNRWVRAGRFPAPLRVSDRWKAWRKGAIDDWVRGDAQ